MLSARCLFKINKQCQHFCKYIHSSKRFTTSNINISENNMTTRSQKTIQLLKDTGAVIPIFCGPMYPGSNPELVAAVSKHGGLGIVQPLALTHLYGHDFRTGLQLIKSLSDHRPFGVNFTILPNKKYKKMMDEWMHISIEEGVKFFLTSLGKPDEIVKIAHMHNIKVYHDVHSVEFAKRAADAGVDGLNLLNCDMGGQTGTLTASAFISELSESNIDLPFVCAGGIGDEKGFAAALDMGYAGIQMGTRFLATPECKITNSYKNGIVNATAKDIVITNKLAGTSSSVIATPEIMKGGLKVNWFMNYLLRQRLTKGLARMFLLTKAVDVYKKSTNDESFQIWQAGKGVSDINAIEPVETILKRFASVKQIST
jgi:nitronate monooxygenase